VNLRLAGRLVILGAVCAGVVLAALNRDRIDVAAVEAWLAGTGAWAPIVFVLAYAFGTTAFVPATLFTLAGGMIFGPLWGTLYNLLAATLAALLMMLIARYVAADYVAAHTGRWIKGVFAGVNEEGWRFVFLMRLIPGIPFAVLNYALGLTRIGVTAYVIATLCGMVPAAIVLGWLGYAGREAAFGDEDVGTKAIAALGGLAALALLTRLVLRLSRRPQAARDAARDTPRGGP
jgi:uncharacterized membrane protein YdjX (TVP38/TMEM64 family)